MTVHKLNNTDHGPERERLKKNLISRLANARIERDRFAPTYNDYYDLSSPAKLRMNDQSNQPRPATDQDEIFDATLQEISEDFVADFSDEFTPSYRPWTKHEAVENVEPGFRKEVDDYIEGRMTFLYDGIRRSTYEEESPEAYHDMGIGPGAMMIRYSQIGPVDCEYVPLAQLLIGPGPKGGTGMRAWERPVEERHLKTIWPDQNWPRILEKNGFDIEDSRTFVTVTEMFVRDYDTLIETWDFYLIFRDKIIAHTRQSGSGSCPLIVARVRVSKPGAYGLGPAAKALPAARVLNELSFLELKRTGKIVDPPGVYSDPAGIFNPEQGFDAGLWYEAGDGFQVTDMSPQNDVREAFFKREDLEFTVRRALFQDKPFQRGLTPPSASQFLGETAEKEKRKTLPRAALHAEWVLPIIRRFEWIFMFRGELEELQVDGRVLTIEPRSPLSRSADIEEVQVADQAMTIYVSKFPEPFQQALDAAKTMRNIGKKLGDKLTVVLDDEKIAARAAAQAAAVAVEGTQ